MIHLPNKSCPSYVGGLCAYSMLISGEPGLATGYRCGELCARVGPRDVKDPAPESYGGFNYEVLRSDMGMQRRHQINKVCNRHKIAADLRETYLSLLASLGDLASKPYVKALGITGSALYGQDAPNDIDVVIWTNNLQDLIKSRTESPGLYPTTLGGLRVDYIMRLRQWHPLYPIMYAGTREIHMSSSSIVQVARAPLGAAIIVHDEDTLWPGARDAVDEIISTVRGGHIARAKRNIRLNLYGNSAACRKHCETCEAQDGFFSIGADQHESVVGCTACTCPMKRVSLTVGTCPKGHFKEGKTCQDK